jgi:hypothetical protein
LGFYGRSGFADVGWGDHSVIMDVMNVEQAKIAEEAGASAVMALGMYSFSPYGYSADDDWDRAYTCEYQKGWWCSQDGE